MELTFAHSISQYHFENMKLKAQQRIREGRPEPVDPLAVNLFLMPEFDASISAPHAIFIGLTLSEVEDVREDIMTWQVSRQRLSSHTRSAFQILLQEFTTYVCYTDMVIRQGIAECRVATHAC